MPFLNNLKRRTGHRRYLRNHATTTEKILWQFLRRRQLAGLKFRRQHSVRGYIIDFYCPEISLAIEIDGEVHDFPDRRRYDQHRQEKLERLGIRFFRCRSTEIYTDAPAVVERIRNYVFPNNITTPNPS